MRFSKSREFGSALDVPTGSASIGDVVVITHIRTDAAAAMRDRRTEVIGTLVGTSELQRGEVDNTSSDPISFIEEINLAALLLQDGRRVVIDYDRGDRGFIQHQEFSE